MADMVRLWYIGEPGALDHPRLAGIRGRWGQAIDVPASLAPELLESGLFSDEKPAGDRPMRPLVEIRSDVTADGPLDPEALEGLGPTKHALLMKADLSTWGTLAEISNRECETWAEVLDGISARQLRKWRNAARAYLAR
jgi:hypothetical protein